MMLNQRDTVNISAWNRTVRLERPGCGDGEGLACDFLRLPDPYSSLWLLSRDRVQHFMRHPFWRCEVADCVMGLSPRLAKQILRPRLDMCKRNAYLAVRCNRTNVRAVIICLSSRQRTNRS